MRSLYENGWRQGSLFRATMATTTYVERGGELELVTREFPQWAVTSQDCELAAADSTDNELLVECMPVLDGNGGGMWGIRSRTFRLNSQAYTDASLPKLKVSPAALGLFIHSMISLEDSRTIAFKTWLGRRYDRPAVPEILVHLARALGAEIKKTRTPALAEMTHDVLFSATEEMPAEFELIGVIVDEGDVDAVRTWLAHAALQVDPALGALSSAPHVLIKAELSLADLENTYSTDLSDITWGKADPRGAL